MNQTEPNHLELLPHDNKRLVILCGQNNEHLLQIEKHLHVHISQRGNHFKILGEPSAIQKARSLLIDLYQQTARGGLNAEKVHFSIVGSNSGGDPSMQMNSNSSKIEPGEIEIRTRYSTIRGHTANQKQYLKNIVQYDINFSIGPAGTGKTYLAVASAVDALEKGKVKRILLVRPAVEAGEKLGFLPGTLEDKISPYLRPLYDALFEMLGFERVEKLISQNIIEIAPLAYMRGRTLNDSFVILDESQNTTTEQMKMFLTRIGFNSKAIITGDITQVDLPRGKKSGLVEAYEVLNDIPGICFSRFGAKDVVRHPLVQQIVEAYDEFNKKQDLE